MCLGEVISGHVEFEVCDVHVDVYSGEFAMRVCSLVVLSGLEQEIWECLLTSHG